MTLPGPTPYDLALEANGAGTIATTGADVIITAAGATAVFTLTNTADAFSGPDLDVSAAFVDGALSWLWYSSPLD